MVARKIIEIRKNKVRCDYGKWKGTYYMRACLDFEDCRGCGAFKQFEKDTKELIREIKRESKKSKRHIREILEQYDEGLLLDLLQYFFNGV